MAAVSSRRQRARGNYWERLDPQRFEYAAGNGEPIGSVEVYDDRDEADQIHVQVRGTRQRPAVLHFDEVEQLDELIADLQAARDAL